MFAEIQIPYLKEVFYTTIIVLVAFIISRAIKNRIFKILDTLPQNLRKGVVSVFNLVIYLLATFAILNVWGINLGNILLSLGAFSIAVSFALKNTIENLVSGVLLMLDRPFKIGDEIEVKGIRGRIFQQKVLKNKALEINRFFEQISF
jgi:small-conductance mechanosensitive channel